ncbi:MAG: hypothetical protein WBG11_15185 [Methylocella sp.]
MPRFIWAAAQSSGARAVIFLHSLTKGGNGLFEPRGSALPLAEPRERITEIHLGCGPIERRALAGIFLQGIAINLDGLLDPRRPVLAFTERFERNGKIRVRQSPLEGALRARKESEAAAIRIDGFDQRPIISGLRPSLQ